MCGINGILSLSSVFNQSLLTLIGEMNKSISHRGPDDNGKWEDRKKGIALGQQRLSIIDLSKSAHQPMKSKQGNVIVFNGEIYNYKEIKKEFLKDYKFISNSDTEVVLAMYEKFGQECLDHFNGMFAFALWDSNKEELFLTRDRAGQKPLYYVEKNGMFTFSSEIKAFFKLPWIKPELDEKALYDFLTFGKLSPPGTMFNGIYKFHPGYKMTVNKSGIQNYSQYWEVKYQDYTHMIKNNLEDIVFSELDQSVKYRMVSDVPVGAFLSGGVDSSAIVALMRKNSDSSIKTYSVGFEGMPDFTELKYAKQVAKKFNTEHYEKLITPDDIKQFLPNITEIFDEPLADPTTIPIYFISKLAKEKGTKVVMTGDGGDELFAGYSNWKRFIKLFPFYKSYSKLPGFIKKSITKIYGTIYPDTPNHEILIRASLDQEFFWGSAGYFKEGIKKRILSDEFLAKNKNLNSHNLVLEYKNNFNKLEKIRKVTDMDWMSYLGFKFVLPNVFLFRADRLGMAHSVETRSPFMDHNFVNLALSIPAEYKLSNGEPKAILKSSLERILPDSILYRKKMGFCVPLKDWAGDILSSYIEKNLKQFCIETNIFDYSELNLQLNSLKKGEEKYTNNLWMLYFLINWFNKWLI